MKKILVYYCTYEITTDAKGSVPRLVASAISYIEKYMEVTYFTFDRKYTDPEIKSSPVYIPVSKKDRVLKRIKKFLSPGFGYSELKRQLIDRYLHQHKTEYPYILALRWPDLKKIRAMYPGSVILFWMHDLTIVNGGDLKMNINYADHVITPSITSYYRIQKSVEPHSLISQWHYIGNWTKENFSLTDEPFTEALKVRHHIKTDTKVFIFLGGDIRFKGGHIIKHAFEKIATGINNDIVVFYAGASDTYDEIIYGKVRIIKIGFISPQVLASYYHLAQFGLFPSLGYDHSPLTLLEMIHSSVLPIASNVGGIWEIMGRDYDLLIDFPNSVDEWCSAIKKSLTLQENARLKALEALQEKISLAHNSNINREKIYRIIAS